MKTVAIIQARMSSKRLAGKVLHEIAGRPMLEWVVTRVRRARLVDDVVVATSSDPADDVLASFCADREVACFRGSEYDVLDRYHAAARAHGADAVVRITADCPFADAAVIDDVIETYHAQPCDYAANINPPSFPDGLDTEVFSLDALARAWREAQLQSEREHVTLYLRNHPERFGLVNVTASWDVSDQRWTVDEPADLEFVRQVARRFDRLDFDYKDVLDVLAEHPELRLINAGFERDAGLKLSLEYDRVAL